jgi:hypothetical protein
MTEEGRGPRSLCVPSTIEVSAAQRGRAGTPLLCFVCPARHDQLLQGYPSSSSAGDDSVIPLRGVSGARILRCVRADHGGTAIITKAIHAAASSARFA